MPKGRGMLYTVWRCCERFAIKPPGVKGTWDDCTGAVQSYMLTYEQIRQYEEVMSDA